MRTIASITDAGLRTEIRLGVVPLTNAESRVLLLIVVLHVRVRVHSSIGQAIDDLPAALETAAIRAVQKGCISAAMSL